MNIIADYISKPTNFGALLRLVCATEASLVVTGALLRHDHPKVKRQVRRWLRDEMSFDELGNKIRYFDKFNEAVDFFHSAGYRVIGTSPYAELLYFDIEYSDKDVVAFGHEATGLGKAKLDLVDTVVKIPMLGKIDSLNVVNAAAVILYEWIRQTMHRSI